MVSQHRQNRINARKGIEPVEKPKEKGVETDDSKIESDGDSK